MQNAPKSINVPHLMVLNNKGAKKVNKKLRDHEKLIQMAEPLTLAFDGRISLVYSQAAHDKLDANIATKRKQKARHIDPGVPLISHTMLSLPSTGKTACPKAPIITPMTKLHSPRDTAP